MRPLTLLALPFFLSGVATAAAPAPRGLLARFPTLAATDGIEPRRIGKFWEDWQLVTTRYREDIDEIRFTFANALAWKTLREGKTAFPDGAAFAKVGSTTAHDAAFPSSAVPDRVARVQLMQKNRRRYGKTDGWGYALFTDGTVATDPAKESASCHACHTVVHERDFVFSVPAFLEVAAIPTSAGFAARFRDVEGAKLPPAAATGFRLSGLDVPQTTVRYGEMALFTGAVAEAGPAVARLARDRGTPHLLIDPKTSAFVLAAPEARSATCQRPVRLVTTSAAGPANAAPPSPLAAQDPAAQANRAGVRRTTWCEEKDVPK